MEPARFCISASQLNCSQPNNPSKLICSSSLCFVPFSSCWYSSFSDEHVVLLCISPFFLHPFPLIIEGAGAKFERKVGSWTQTLARTIFLVYLTSCIHLALSYALLIIPFSIPLFDGCSVGFSGDSPFSLICVQCWQCRIFVCIADDKSRVWSNNTSTLWCCWI